MKINIIYRAVKYFDKKMTMQRNQLKKNVAHSKNGSFAKKNYTWRDEYDEMMKTMRGE